MHGADKGEGRQYLSKKIFIIASVARFSEALGVVKKICTVSSTARPPVKDHSKGSLAGVAPFSRRSSPAPLLTRRRNCLARGSRGRGEKSRRRSLRFPMFLLAARRNLGQVAVRGCTRASEMKGRRTLSFPAERRPDRSRYRGERKTAWLPVSSHARSPGHYADATYSCRSTSNQLF